MLRVEAEALGEVVSETVRLELERGEGGGVGNEDIEIILVPRASIRSWLTEQKNAGVTIDFKIHAALWAAEI